MPVTVARSESQIRFTLIGSYAFEEVLEAVTDAPLPPSTERRMLGILDVRQSEELREPQELRTLARCLAAPGVFSSFAVVAKRAVHYGLARMLSVFAEQEGLELVAFRSEDAALEWLGST
jgi:hypothetical protein